MIAFIKDLMSQPVRSAAAAPVNDLRHLSVREIVGRLALWAFILT